MSSKSQAKKRRRDAAEDEQELQDNAPPPKRTPREPAKSKSRASAENNDPQASAGDSDNETHPAPRRKEKTDGGKKGGKKSQQQAQVLSTSTSTHTSTLQDDYTELQDEHEALKHTLQERDERIALLESELLQLTEDFDNATKDVATRDSTITKLEEMVKRLQARVKDAPSVRNDDALVQRIAAEAELAARTVILDHKKFEETFEDSMRTKLFSTDRYQSSGALTYDARTASAGKLSVSEAKKLVKSIQGLLQSDRRTERRDIESNAALFYLDYVCTMTEAGKTKFWRKFVRRRAKLAAIPADAEYLTVEMLTQTYPFVTETKDGAVLLDKVVDRIQHSSLRAKRMGAVNLELDRAVVRVYLACLFLGIEVDGNVIKVVKAAIRELAGPALTDNDALEPKVLDSINTMVSLEHNDYLSTLDEQGEAPES